MLGRTLDEVLDLLSYCCRNTAVAAADRLSNGYSRLKMSMTSRCYQLRYCVLEPERRVDFFELRTLRQKDMHFQCLPGGRWVDSPHSVAVGAVGEYGLSCQPDGQWSQLWGHHTVAADVGLLAGPCYDCHLTTLSVASSLIAPWTGGGLPMPMVFGLTKTTKCLALLHDLCTTWIVCGSIYDTR